MDSIWITPKKRLQRTAMYRFEKTVQAKKNSLIILSISADTRYKLKVNGKYVCEGPCQSDHFYQRYEKVTLPKNILRDGDNLFSVEVYHVKERAYVTQSRKEEPALWINGTVDGEYFGTSTDWKCYIEHKYAFERADVTKISETMPHVERISCEQDEETSCVWYSNCTFEHDNRTAYGCLIEKYAMKPREIALLKPGKAVAFNEICRSNISVELDAGIYTTAYPKFVFKGKAGARIRFIYAECYCNPETGKKGRRDKAEGVINGYYWDEVELNGKHQEYTPFLMRPFRYVKAEFPEGTEFLTEKQSYQPYFYPMEEKGYVKSNELNNRLWDISLNTLRCCSHETFVDCPYFEQAQYDMDTYLEMMFMFRVTNDYSLGRKAVYDLSRSIEPDGMLCAHYPSLQRQVIPTFSLFWIHMLADYVLYSGDLYVGKELLPVADRILTAFELLRNSDGIVGSTKHWHYTDWVPGWNRGVPPHGEDNPITLSSMMYSVALDKASWLAKEVGRNELSKEYKKRRESVNKAVNTHCYDKEKQFYVDVYGHGGYSEHTAVWAVLSDAVIGDEAKELLKRSFAMNVNRASFSFNFFTFRALEKAGLYNEFSSKLFDGWHKMKDMGCTTWCENPDDPRSECHAWSSAPIYEFSAMYLGVKPSAIGFKKAVIAPSLTFAENVEGSVPTLKGEIKVSWRKLENKTELKIKVPRGIKAKLKLFDREEIISGERVFEITD